jgi:hypothetical protein
MAYDTATPRRSRESEADSRQRYASDIVAYGFDERMRAVIAIEYGSVVLELMEQFVQENIDASFIFLQTGLERIMLDFTTPSPSRSASVDSFEN